MYPIVLGNHGPLVCVAPWCFGRDAKRDGLANLCDMTGSRCLICSIFVEIHPGKKLGSSTMVGVMLIGFHGYRHTDFTPISLDILKLYRRVAENVAFFSR